MPIHELHDRLEASRSSDALTLLDVRTDAEWSNGHLPGAIHIFAGEIESRLDELDRQKKILVYCGSDFRADLVASLLKAEGFKDVHTLLGSIKAWINAGFNLEKS